MNRRGRMVQWVSGAREPSLTQHTTLCNRRTDEFSPWSGFQETVSALFHQIFQAIAPKVLLWWTTTAGATKDFFHQAVQTIVQKASSAWEWIIQKIAARTWLVLKVLGYNLHQSFQAIAPKVLLWWTTIAGATKDFFHQAVQTIVQKVLLAWKWMIKKIAAGIWLVLKVLGYNLHQSFQAITNKVLVCWTTTAGVAKDVFHQAVQTIIQKALSAGRWIIEKIAAGTWLILKVLGSILLVFVAITVVLLAIKLYINYRARNYAIAPAGAPQILDAFSAFVRRVTGEAARDAQRQREQEEAQRREAEARRRVEEQRRDGEERRRRQQQQQQQQQQEEARRAEEEQQRQRARKHKASSRKTTSVDTKAFEAWVDISETFLKATDPCVSCSPQPPSESPLCPEVNCEKTRTALGIRFCKCSMGRLVAGYAEAKSMKQKEILDRLVRIWHPDRYMKHDKKVREQAEEMTKILKGLNDKKI